MTLKENGEIVETLLTEEEVTFTYGKHFIEIFECSEGGYEGSVYASEKAFENEEEPLDGGTVETIVACVAIEFFIDISRELTERGL